MRDPRTATTMEMISQLSAAGYGGCWLEPPLALPPAALSLEAAAWRKEYRRLVASYLIASVGGALFWAAVGGMVRALLSL